MQGRLDQLKILSKCLRKPLVSKHLGFGTADMGLWIGTYFVDFSKEERCHSREIPFPRKVRDEQREHLEMAKALLVAISEAAGDPACTCVHRSEQRHNHMHTHAHTCMHMGTHALISMQLSV